ncbi:dipeptidase [Aquibacillus rhizosphaerae]|uniref:Membrane dipeptidase n=1 Tax=Aquibacillus rhizosphaerae TaxID=3051431 RepID=A0ABT7KZM1_9BACI|nr:membrane dipeptidase [Aquibacillus sp. LR5S19]MDL4838991.1 membrane dipeptidase [Aquibacillus sp. LR5S19]
MDVIDAHCDVLLKLWENNLSFYSSDQLQVNYIKWKESSVKVQCFAIFVPDNVPEELQFTVALEMVSLFFEQVIEPYKDVKFISNKDDLINLNDDELGAILTLEGCHVIGNDINKLKTLIRLGVRSVGLTWNQANAVCDGIGEERGAGLSSFGEEVVHLLNKEKIWTDVSHISYQGFFDVMNIAKFPMASHSNAKSLSSHKRNLDDIQIRALIDQDGWIGVTFVADFLSEVNGGTREDIIRHINYYLTMGGESCLGFGSDFDGTDKYIISMYDYSDYELLLTELSKTIERDKLHKICLQNFIEKFPHTGS